MGIRTARPSRRRLGLAFVVMSMAALMLSTTLAGTASAHGSVADPASRLYACMYDEDARANNEMCLQAWEQNPTALYNWMALLIGDAGGQSESIIPDGRLCSADNDTYAAFDAPGAWPATEVDNTFTVTWDSSPGPHKATYYSYVTKQGFDPLTEPLTWGDLEQVGFADGFNVEGPESASNSYEVSAPGRTGRHVLFTVWQRPDTAEAFYACSDVIFPGGDAAGGGTDGSTGGDDTASEAPADEAAGEQVSDEEVSDEEVPAEGTAGEETPVTDDGSAEEAPADDAGAAAQDDAAAGEDTAGEDTAGETPAAGPGGAFDFAGILEALMSLLTMFSGLFG